MSDKLKLKARDAEDLAIISSILQDAVIPITEMRYLESENRFALVASRFRWEHCESGDCSAYERINCGVLFDDVKGVKVRNLDLADRGQTLDLLALAPEPGAIRLTFGGAAELRLEVGSILCHLEDIGEPWPTRWRPGHPDVDGD